MTSSTGTNGLTRAASPPRPRQRVAHGREVDDPGHTGEVLHQHPFRGQGDLVRRVPGPLPVALGVLPQAATATMSSAETWGPSS